MISIVIPSRANNIPLLNNIFSCLQEQSYQDFEVLLVCDRSFTKKERADFQKAIQDLQLSIYPKIQLISQHNSDFLPQSSWGASYVRNYGIKKAKGEFIQLFDDDNEIDPNYLQKALDYHKEFSKKYQKEVLITPSLMRRKTGKVQNQGFSSYSYILAKPKVHFLKEGEDYAEIQMFSGNGIFSPASIMKKSLYDEHIARISEDLDFIYRIHKAGYPILVFKDLQVEHMERDKSILEESWIGNYKSAKQKITNLFIWNKKYANIGQTIVFFWFSIWGISIWLSIKSLRFGKEKKREVIKGIFAGRPAGRKAYRATQKRKKAV